MIHVPITSLFAAAFAVALVMLSIPVTLRRIKVGDLVGDSRDEKLQHRIRAQGNFIEYVPLGVITLGLVEAQGAAAWLVFAIGGTLGLGRLLHAVGMLRANAPLRGFGMIFTYLALIAAAACLISLVLDIAPF
ncbi:putative membrane protein YecN with MAPEG domain [Rhizobium sp. SG_E_25_P2]|uniref:MAPEG family protein n=1 Tax=Rhizobium sp. SG_E_25_P2 TaxID=2879942 RepID=UPI002475B128|nr:MAPEG family protein [Rhizobium sp. SG_E_25_P2]MDH6268153.1 putative membrane protein YecN with MAPEG domain [Rhizobium sp. SG_E_25_P2]